MSDIICQWLNSELRLSKVVEPQTFARDFSNGYLIGEILHRYEMQEDFHLFSKQNTANAKLNNFTRVEPTLHLLTVPFDLSMARALMQGRHGAATQLLYQLYILLQRKSKTGLTATAMEVMQPTASARLHRFENIIYTQRLKTVVKRDTDLKMQKIAKHFHKRGQDMYNCSATIELQKEDERLKRQDERRLKDREKHRQIRRKQVETMIKIQSAVVQIPKPPHSRAPRASEKQQQFRKKQEAQHVQSEIARFEKSRTDKAEASLCSSRETQSTSVRDKEKWNQEYIENIRQRLEEDSAAREQREMRRRRALMQQIQAHEAQQEALRDEQMVARLTRQTQQEKRITVQLRQILQQKEVLRQNRIFQEMQFQERRRRDFQEALDREAALAQQERLENSEQLKKENELHKQLLAERAQARHCKHFNICREVLEQMLDLATKVGEYRLLTANLIPVKQMQEWMQLFFSGKPLYEVALVDPMPSEPTAEQIIELQKLQILNDRDYNEYVAMTGEWGWQEEKRSQSPAESNDFLDHVLNRLQSLVIPPILNTPPLFHRFTIRASMLGKTCSGKSSCLSRISNTLGIHVLSANSLIQGALSAYQQVKQAHSSKDVQDLLESNEGKQQSPQQTPQESVNNIALNFLTPELKETSEVDKKEEKDALKGPLQAQHGAAVEKALRTGRAVPDQLLVDIIVDAMRSIPADSGWILDGFPMDVSQAQMLEDALNGTGADESHKKTIIALSTDTTPKVPAPPSPVLDVVLLLDVSDEQILERATVARESRSQERDAIDEATDDQTFTSEDGSLGRKQIQHRISGFHQTWPKLEKWFGQRQNILVKIPADADEETVFRNVEMVLQETMAAVEKGAAVGHSRPVSGSSVPEPLRPETTCSPRSSPATQRNYEISDYLLPFWENICKSYATNVKTVMQNLRGERHLIIHHLYNLRENFRQHLQKPDLKQEFVSVWQRDYNSIPDSLREDEETKGELHQRLDDLRERLWDISDKRKEEAEQERRAVIEDTWLDDHMALLINHYSALIQAELSRFWDTLRLLRDYYSAMSTPAFPESTQSLTRVPLLDVTAENHQSPEEQINSAEKSSKAAEEKDPDMKDKKKAKVFPLVPCRSPTPELLKQPLRVPDEKLLLELLQTALTSIKSVVTAEVRQSEEEEAQEEHKQMEAQKPSSLTAVSEKVKGGKQKGAPTPPQEPSPQPVVKKNPEELKKKEERKRITQEFSDALRCEEAGVKQRLKLVKSHALRTLSSLQERAEQVFTSMNDWLEARFLSEMKSIQQLTEVVQLHIENGVQLHHELLLQSTDFCVDGDMRVVETPLPPPQHPLLEQSENSTLTVQQLQKLHVFFSKTAPAGLMSRNEMAGVLQGLTSHMGRDVLPEPWMHITPPQVEEMVGLLAQGSEMLDWRRFLLCAALPWPIPSLPQLLNTLRCYRDLDTAGTGLITLEQFQQVDLWFGHEQDVPVPEDPPPSDRPAKLKKFVFSLFAETQRSVLMMNYVKMLRYFCCHPEAPQGFTRALGLHTGHMLSYNHGSLLIKSVPNMEGTGVQECDAAAQDEGSEEVGVSIDDVLQVLCQGEDLDSHISHLNRFQSDGRNREELEEVEHTGSDLELLKVFEDLGFKEEQKIPFSTLSQHPFLQELMEGCSKYLLLVS
ncbi:hypothetical protein DNTS_011674 [Danionella cerebrum]|uniref:Calponin-homology (CH) domain-containing protein n=1 Tax=Danionella cerebrum TaxID=2873325 RepID=A0A553P194_9TELE|nr:hypothetical protein DNTS_011674 [Danionella translucida]